MANIRAFAGTDFRSSPVGCSSKPVLDLIQEWRAGAAARRSGSPAPSRRPTPPLRPEDLDEFVRLYQPANRHDRAPTWSESTPDGRWRVYDYNALVARDKASLDIFWLKDDSLANSDNLPAPDVIAQEIVDDLEAALEQFRLIAGDIGAFDTAAS